MNLVLKNINMNLNYYLGNIFIIMIIMNNILNAYEIYLSNSNHDWINTKNNENQFGTFNDLNNDLIQFETKDQIKSNHHISDGINLNEHHYWIETLVFADYTVLERFENKSEAEKYVITLLKMTDDLFHHPTLGVNISLVIQDIIWVSEIESNELLWGSSLIRSVHRFCSWALTHHYVRYNYDHALLLSRNIVQAAGISPLNQMCQMQYSCTLAEDSGFFSAYPIAHEIMHSLGVEHDGESNSCDRSGLGGNIMAPLILSASHNHHWSDCTRLVLKNSLELQKFSCLRDYPLFKPEYIKSDPPGWYWSLDQQCFILSGSNLSQFCPGVEEYACQELWCSVSRSKNHCDRMLNHGLLDGTSCGFKKECLHGKCIDSLALLNYRKIKSDYSRWSPCSRKCGIGTRYRINKCNQLSSSLASWNSHECDNKQIEYQLCNIISNENCSLSVDYREEQCSRFNGFKLRGVYHTWLPYLYPHKPCHLACYSNQNGQILDASVSVRDSTPCTYDDPDARCIQNICVKFDCLGNVNGTAKRDRCGVCEGDNSTCTIVNHKIRRSLPINGAYRLIYLIPRFARNLKVEKLSDDYVLGLFDMSRFQFILQGEDIEQGTELKRVYFGTEFTFTPISSEQNKSFVQISATGPIYGDIAIQARLSGTMVQSEILTLDISYAIPNE